MTDLKTTKKKLGFLPHSKKSNLQNSKKTSTPNLNKYEAPEASYEQRGYGGVQRQMMKHSEVDMDAQRRSAKSEEKYSSPNKKTRAGNSDAKAARDVKKAQASRKGSGSVTSKDYTAGKGKVVKKSTKRGTRKSNDGK